MKKFLNDIKRWLSYYSVCRKIYDFDYSSILSVEYHQLKRVRDSIIHYHNYIGWDKNVNNINLALKLLDIIKENGCARRVKGNYIMPIYVNCRNYKRFYNNPIFEKYFEDPETGSLWKDGLRIDKAWHLYNEIRYRYFRDWWV